jgi:cytochrome b subunit of formate dehydrogenase
MSVAKSRSTRRPAVTRGLRALVAAAAVSLCAVLAGVAAPLALAEEVDDPDGCLECHAVGATKEGAPEGKRVDPKAYGGSVHAKSCVQCHEDMEEFPHAKKKADPVNCSNCHEDAVKKFEQTPHAKLPKEGPRHGPTCVTCHPPHAVTSAKDEHSPVHKKNLPDTCGQCHGGTNAEGAVRVAKTVADYRHSVHGVEVLEKANYKAPGCTDCHPVHEMRMAFDPSSKIFKPNIPKLCGQCHADVAKVYAESIHGTALAAGRQDSPACNDCHTEHGIQKPDAADSTVFAGHVSQTCSGCHAAERITRRYGLAADRVASYRDSYHGLADLGGSTAAANCASCHGFHDVLPSTDPKSRIHKDNLLQTCSACHQGATQGFIEGRVHASTDPEQDKAAFWIRTFYLWIIPGTIGGMLLHNAVIWFKYVRDRYRVQKASTSYVRWTRQEVFVHAAIASSFILLAVTGFALAFPQAAWVEGLASLGMTEGVRGWLHRAAAVVFSVASVWHFAFVLASKHGRYAFGRMLPRLQDLRDAQANMAYHLGLSKQAPKFDRWDYTMKVEYWALVWGGIVMAVTGGMLWFKVEVTEFVPRWMVYAAEKVHYYEAILAVLAILVWHFFFVIFHPAEYPLNLTFLTGRKTEHDMKHAHPLEYERVKDSPEYRVPPQKPAHDDGRSAGGNGHTHP